MLTMEVILTRVMILAFLMRVSSLPQGFSKAPFRVFELARGRDKVALPLNSTPSFDQKLSNKFTSFQTRLREKS